MLQSAVKDTWRRKVSAAAVDVTDVTVSKGHSSRQPRKLGSRRATCRLTHVIFTWGSSLHLANYHSRSPGTIDAIVDALRLRSLHLGRGVTVAVRYDGLRLMPRLENCCLLFGSRTEVDGALVVVLKGVVLDVNSGHVDDLRF